MLINVLGGAIKKRAAGEFITTPEANGWADPNTVAQNTTAFNDAIILANANAGSSSTGRGVVELVQSKTYTITGSSGARDRSNGCIDALDNVEIRTTGKPTVQGNKALLQLDPAADNDAGAGNFHNLAVVASRAISNSHLGWLRVDGNKFNITEANVDYTEGNNGGLNCVAIQGGTGNRLFHVEAFDGWTDGIWIDEDPDETGDIVHTTDFRAEDCDFHNNRRQGMSVIHCGLAAQTFDQLVFLRTQFRNTGDDGALDGNRPGAGVDLESNQDRATDPLIGITFDTCTFDNNGPASSNNGSPVGAGGGRGLQVDTAVSGGVGDGELNFFKVLGCTFTNNFANAINVNIRSGSQGQSDLTDADFTDNVASGNGNDQFAFEDSNGSSPSKLSSTTFTNNDVDEILFKATLAATGNDVIVTLGGFNPTVTTNGRQTITIGAGAAVAFDAGYAPVPQDPAFQNWTNSGWPRGRVPKSPTDNPTIAELRNWVQMHVPNGSGVEPQYHDNPVVANDESDASGAVEIRLKAGPGAWQGAGQSVTTSIGVWLVNADGLHLSYRPISRASGTGADEIDTEAEYRFSTNGGSSFSDPGDLTIRQIKPLGPVTFIEDFLTPNVDLAQRTEMQNCINAATPSNGAITQRDFSDRFIFNSTGTTGPKMLPDGSANIASLYGLNISASVPSEGDKNLKTFARADWADDAANPQLELMFVDFDGKAGQQLTNGSTVNPWAYTFDLEQRHFMLYATDDGAVSQGNGLPTANKGKVRARYCVAYNHVADFLSVSWSSNATVQFCDGFGVFRGICTSAGSDMDITIEDTRCLAGPIDERGKRTLGQFNRHEPEWIYGDRIIVTRVLHDLYIHIDEKIQTAGPAIAGTLATNIQIDDLYQNRNYGGYNELDVSYRSTNSRYMAGGIDDPGSFPSTQTFIEKGWNGPRAIQRIFTDCEIIITNKGTLGLGQGVYITPATTDELAAWLAWVFVDSSPPANSLGWVDTFDGCTIRLDEGMTGHTGSIYGFKLFTGDGDANTLRLLDCTFVEAQDGTEFDACVDGLAGNDLRVEYDSATDSNNAALISAGRFFGPNTTAVAI